MNIEKWEFLDEVESDWILLQIESQQILPFYIGGSLRISESQYYIDDETYRLFYIISNITNKPSVERLIN